MAHASAPRLTYRLVSAQALQQQMEFQRMTIRELSEACGRPSYRSTIGNLRSGARNTCGPHLAARIERVLRVAPGLLFTPVMSNAQPVATPSYRGARAA